MRVVVSAIGKFHTWDLARELYKEQCIGRNFHGMSSMETENEGTSGRQDMDDHWIHAPYMFLVSRGFAELLGGEWTWLMDLTDRCQARNIPEAAMFMLDFLVRA